MELKTDKRIDGLSKSQINKLNERGVTDYEVLKVCWKSFVTSEVGIKHIILILQAYCLIYPLKLTAEYIIPSKLPDKFRCPQLKRMEACPTFYFDFHQFLPDEIYHRLICLITSEAKPQKHLPHCYSEKKCFFSGLMDTEWIIQMEVKEQRLKIMVL